MGFTARESGLKFGLVTKQPSYLNQLYFNTKRKKLPLWQQANILLSLLLIQAPVLCSVLWSLSGSHKSRQRRDSKKKKKRKQISYTQETWRTTEGHRGTLCDQEPEDRSKGKANAKASVKVWASLVAHSNASAYSVGDLGSIPGLGRYPREVNGNPLQ